MIMAHLIDENLFDYSLQTVARTYLGDSKEKELSRVMSKSMKWEETPAFAMARYAEQDTKLTRDLYLTLKPLFEMYEPVWETDAKFMRLLWKMESRGIKVNLDEAHRLKKMCEDRLLAIQAELGFNPNKTKELQERLFAQPPIGYGLKPLSRTPKTNKPKVDTQFLERTNHPVCGLLLEHSKLKKQLTSYYNSYINLCEGYGRLHPSFKQHGTKTGRLSCADPNMQQIPRDSPIKKLFLAEPGYELWEIDFSNIELRIAAVYAQEPNLLEVFRNNGDVHQLTADRLGISRQDAKMVNFLVTFGGGADLLANKLNKSPSVCRPFVDGFKKSYARIFATLSAAEEAAGAQGGKIRLWSGRWRHFKWSSEYRGAWNSLVQGGAFEIVKRSMLKLEEAGYDIRNQVHDSVWLMVPAATAKQDIERAEEIMSGWTEEAFKLRFSVDSKRLN
jgi:DNA polymerase-1